MTLRDFLNICLEAASVSAQPSTEYAAGVVLQLLLQLGNWVIVWMNYEGISECCVYYLLLVVTAS